MPMLDALLDVVDDATDDREHQGFLEVLLRGSPSSGGGSSDRGSDQNSEHSTVMRASSVSHRSVHAGRSL